jgi:hypothetical protein
MKLGIRDLRGAVAAVVTCAPRAQGFGWKRIANGLGLVSER